MSPLKLPLFQDEMFASCAHRCGPMGSARQALPQAWDTPPSVLWGTPYLHWRGLPLRGACYSGWEG